MLIQVSATIVIVTGKKQRRGFFSKDFAVIAIDTIKIAARLVLFENHHDLFMVNEDARLQVTDVRIYPTDDLKNTIGFAHVVISDALIIRDLRLVRGKKGLFVSMPAFHRRDGKFRDIVSPLSQKMRDLLTNAVVDAYRREHPQTVAREDIYQPLQHSSDSVENI